MDNEIFDVITKELDRQTYNIELIASENYVSDSVLRAQGSILTNKYAEGYPDKRYYGGCEFVDIVEKIAIERLKSLYSVDFANVQPHSGSQANTAVYSAFMDPGDAILGLSLDKGGHLIMDHLSILVEKFISLFSMGWMIMNSLITKKLIHLLPSISLKLL